MNRFTVARVLPSVALVALATVVLAPRAVAADASDTTVSISTFTVFQDQCAGGVQSQAVLNVQSMFQGVFGPHSGLPIPVISPNPGCTPAPAALSSLISASNTIVSSPSGSATVSSQALGNAVFPEQAWALVRFAAQVPLSAPASSVDVSIPYRTAGTNWTTPAAGDTADSGVFVGPAYQYGVPRCTDGTYATLSPYFDFGTDDILPYDVRTPAGSGTYDRVRFYCQSGSQLASGLWFEVVVASEVHSASGQTETASADFQMHDVTATIHS